MPSLIYAKVYLESWSEDSAVENNGFEVTCIRALLDDASRLHASAFPDLFSKMNAAEVLAEWKSNGLLSEAVPAIAQRLLRDAFEAADLGEAYVEFRNQQEGVAPGVVPVLCSILRYLADCCGTGGSVRLVSDNET